MGNINSKTKGKVAWKDVVGYEGLYAVSSLGDVKSLPRNTTKGKILKPHVNISNGYCYVCLSKNNKKENCRVHKIVMSSFYGVMNKWYDKNKTINHINGDKTDNRLDNLEFCSQSENQNHAYSVGLQKPKGLQVICLNNKMVFNSCSEASRWCGGSIGELVARVCRGERSHYRGFKFAFLDDYNKGLIPTYKGKCVRKESKLLWKKRKEK